jgi:hypothetical protein
LTALLLLRKQPSSVVGLGAFRMAPSARSKGYGGYNRYILLPGCGGKLDRIVVNIMMILSLMTTAPAEDSLPKSD